MGFRQERRRARFERTFKAEVDRMANVLADAGVTPSEFPARFRAACAYAQNSLNPELQRFQLPTYIGVDWPSYERGLVEYAAQRFGVKVSFGDDE